MSFLSNNTFYQYFRCGSAIRYLNKAVATNNQTLINDRVTYTKIIDACFVLYEDMVVNGNYIEVEVFLMPTMDECLNNIGLKTQGEFRSDGKTLTYYNQMVSAFETICYNHFNSGASKLNKSNDPLVCYIRNALMPKGLARTQMSGYILHTICAAYLTDLAISSRKLSGMALDNFIDLLDLKPNFKMHKYYHALRCCEQINKI